MSMTVPLSRAQVPLQELRTQKHAAAVVVAWSFKRGSHIPRPDEDVDPVPKPLASHFASFLDLRNPADDMPRLGSRLKACKRRMRPRLLMVDVLGGLGQSSMR